MYSSEVIVNIANGKLNLLQIFILLLEFRIFYCFEENLRIIWILICTDEFAKKLQFMKSNAFSYVAILSIIPKLIRLN